MDATVAGARPDRRWFGAAVAAWLATAACAQDSAPPGATDAIRPESAGRLVRVFDFEEADTNPGRVPRHWFRSQEDPKNAVARPGFPAWNQAELSYVGEGGEAFAGGGSVMLPTRGGSTSLLLGEGVVPVFENADYLLTARVKTGELIHSRACVIGRFLNRAGLAIAESESRSDMVVTDGVWQELSLELVGDFPDAAYIQVELAVLQPEQYTPPRHGVPEEHRVWRQDFAGAAWFDDVRVMQLPRVELTTTSPCNIVSLPEKPRLSALVRDLTGEALRMRVEVATVDGRVADIIEKDIGAGLTTTAWSPELPALGWYRATMTLSNQAGERVGGAHVDFAWIPGERTTEGVANAASLPRGSADRPRFGLVIDDLPASMAAQIPEVVKSLGAGSITLPLWSTDLTPEEAAARTGAVLPVISAMLENWQDVSVSVGRVPDALGRVLRVDSDDPWSALLTAREGWAPYLTPMLERFGQRVNRWQIGQAGDDRVLRRPQLTTEIDAIRKELSGLVPGPELGITARADGGWSDVPAGAENRFWLLATAPHAMTAEDVGAATRSWLRAQPDAPEERPELTIVFERSIPQGLAAAAGPRELVKRAVEFWAAGSREDGGFERGLKMAVQQPWERTGNRRPQLMPAPELAAWRNTIDRLTDRRVVGTFPIADGVVCYVLAPGEGAPADRGGALVAWSNGAALDGPVLTADLGLDPVRVVDIYGNSRDAGRLTREGRRSLVRIPIGEDPVFIEGIDVALVRFLSLVRIEPGFLESNNEQHEHAIVIQNPWNTGITGRISILEPGGFETGQRNRAWQITPRSSGFAIPAGATERLPMTISFSPVEEVGSKEFVMELELAADKPYGTIEVRRLVEVGLRHIGLELSSSVQDDDLIVEATVSNTGQDPLALELTCFAPGKPRSKASITDLTPGSQVVKRFVYAGAGADLGGGRILVSLSDPESGARLTKSVVAH